MVHRHVHLPSLCRQTLCLLVQGQATGMLPQQSGRHAGHAQLQKQTPRPGVSWKAVSQHDPLSVLLPDHDQTVNEAPPLATITAASGTAVVQLQLELLCIKAAGVVVIIYLMTG